MDEALRISLSRTLVHGTRIADVILLQVLPTRYKRRSQGFGDKERLWILRVSDGYVAIGYNDRGVSTAVRYEEGLVLFVSLERFVSYPRGKVKGKCFWIGLYTHHQRRYDSVGCDWP